MNFYLLYEFGYTNYSIMVEREIFLDVLNAWKRSTSVYVVDNGEVTCYYIVDRSGAKRFIARAFA